MDQPEASPSNTQRREEEFYWEPISFLVGGVLFKVPKDHLLKGSSHFANQCSLSLQHHGGPQDGAAPPDLVSLPDVSVEEFRSFLKVLYPSRPTTAKLAKDQWLSVLKLSTKWFFKGLRKISIAQLDALELAPTDKVCLGKEYHISRWVLAGYDSLVRNQDLIPHEDAERIGYKSTVSLYMCREKRLYDENLEYLHEAFKQELDELAEEEQLHLSGGAGAVDDVDVDESEAEDAYGRNTIEENKRQHEKLQAEVVRLSEKLEKRRKDAMESEATIQDLQKVLLRTEAERDRGLEEHRSAIASLEKALSDSEATVKEKKEECEGILARYRHLEADLRKAISDANEALATEREGRRRDREERDNEQHARTMVEVTKDLVLRQVAKPGKASGKGTASNRVEDDTPMRRVTRRPRACSRSASDSDSTFNSTRPMRTRRSGPHAGLPPKPAPLDTLNGNAGEGVTMSRPSTSTWTLGPTLINIPKRKTSPVRPKAKPFPILAPDSPIISPPKLPHNLLQQVAPDRANPRKRRKAEPSNSSDARPLEIVSDKARPQGSGQK